MTQLHNNYKDVFRALRLGFSLKKLTMMVWGYILGLVGYIIFTYAAYLAAGWTFAQIWDGYRLFPVPEGLPWFGWLIWAIGGLYSLCVILITGTAVAKVTLEQLKGDDFYQMSKAFRFATDRAKSTLTSPVMAILFIISIVIAGLILSLIGCIPYFGEIFTGIMIIPAFAASLFIVYLLIIFIFTILYGPVVVATTGNDTFDTLFEVFSMLNDQPARLIWYTIIVGALAKVGAFVLGILTRFAIYIGGSILSTIMGGKMVDILYNAASTIKITIPYWCPEPSAFLTDKLLTMMAGPSLIAPPPYQHINIAILIASILVAIGYYLIILFIISYGTTVWFTGATCAYLVITKKKDDRNLLEVKEESFITKEKPQETPAK
jgi:hypothetical protein